MFKSISICFKLSLPKHIQNEIKQNELHLKTKYKQTFNNQIATYSRWNVKTFYLNSKSITLIHEEREKHGG